MKKNNQIWLVFMATHLMVCAEHHELFWTVQWTVASPDSYPRPIIAIKPEQSPSMNVYDNIEAQPVLFGGPTIYVQQHDTLHVYVTNKLSDRVVSIHWHGLHQKNNAANDGVPGLTQSGILPMHTFVYRLNITQEPGTHFYHSHSGLQSSDGFQGMFVIREKQQQSVVIATQQQQLEQPPVNDYVVALQDWHHELSTTLLAKYIARNGAYEGFIADYPYPAVSILINGKGQFNCETQFVSEQDCELVRKWGWPFVLSGYNDSMRFPPKQESWQTNGQCNPSRAPFVGACNTSSTPYSEFVCVRGRSIRMRLVGSGFSLGVRFWIDGHNLTIVAKDGNLIQPVIEHQEAVFLHAGERLDVLVDCEQTPRHYYIFAAIAYEYYGKTAHLKSPNVSSYAVLRYDESMQQLNKMEPAQCPPDEWPQSHIQPMFFYPSNRHVANPAKQQFFIWSQSKGHWWNYETNTSGKRLEWWELNAHTPWNLANMDSILDMCAKDPNTNMSLLFTTQQQPLIFNLVYNTTYDFVLVNNESQPHPWHVHGYSVDVLRVGAIHDMTHLLYDWNMTVENVMRADTFITPAKGFVQFRIVADNPGPWLVHCHMPYHAEVGMSFLLSVAYDGKSCAYQQPINADVVAYWRDVSTATIIAFIVSMFVIVPLLVALIACVLGYGVKKCRRQHTLNAEYLQAIPLA